jgi:hypothetical protein
MPEDVQGADGSSAEDSDEARWDDTSCDEAWDAAHARCTALVDSMALRARRALAARYDPADPPAKVLHPAEVEQRRRALQHTPDPTDSADTSANLDPADTSATLDPDTSATFDPDASATFDADTSAALDLPDYSIPIPDTAPSPAHANVSIDDPPLPYTRPSHP